VLSACLVVACLVVSQPAEASWTPVVTLSATGWQGQDWPVVAVSRQGQSLLVWSACKTGGTECIFQVQARIRHRGGGMGQVKTLSPLTAGDAAWPEVASSDTGDAAVVWQNDSSQVLGRRVSASGGLGALRTLSRPGMLSINPEVVTAPTGSAFVVWMQENNGGWTVAGRRFSKDGSLGPVLTLGSAVADFPGVAIDRHGTAVVAWTEPGSKVVARRIRPGHVSPLRVIMPAASGIGYGMVTVGDDRDGDAVICFNRSINSGNGGPTHVWARRWTRTGRVGTVLRLSSATRNVTFYHAVSTDLAGASTVVWGQWTSQGGTAMYGRRISKTGSLGPIRSLGAGDRPAVALDDAGAGLAVWQSPGANTGASKVVGRRISTSGSFGPLVQLSSDGGVVRVASSPLGHFSITWQQRSAPYRIRARFGP
jgi:hypothetical protein